MGTLNIGRCFPREATAGPDPERITGGSGPPASKPKGSRETLLALGPAQRDYVYIEASDNVT